MMSPNAKRSICEAETDRIVAALQQGARNLIFVYDDRPSPLAFGEYLNFLMVARVLQRADCLVSVIHIEGENRRDFGFWTDEPPVSSYLAQRRSIAQAMVGSESLEVSGCSWAQFSSRFLGQRSGDTFILFERFVASREPVYVFCHCLMNLLLAGPLAHALEDRLLDSPTKPLCGARPTRKPRSPYIAWVARFNQLWAPERNLGEVEFLHLRRLLADSFPEIPLILVSDSVGCAHYADLADRNGLPLLVSKVFSNDFLGDAELLLGALLVVQLRGGGMNSVAQFSRVPYYTIAPVIHEVMWNDRALTSFATEHQTFHNSAQWLSDNDFQAKASLILARL